MINTNTHKPNFEVAIDNHIARWEAMRTQCGATNVPLAEESVVNLYRLASKKSPAVIWCRSPLEMAILPSVVTNIVQSKEWSDICARMKRVGRHSEQAWQDAWNQEWQLLDKSHVRQMANEFLNLKHFDRVDPSLKAAFIEHLPKVMCDVLAENNLQPGEMRIDPASPLVLPMYRKSCLERVKANEAIWQASAPMDFSIYKRLLELNRKVELIAGVKLSANFMTICSFFFQGLDPRVITESLPISYPLFDKHKPTPEKAARAQLVKDRCNAFAMPMLENFMWFHRLFVFINDEPTPAPQTSTVGGKGPIEFFDSVKKTVDEAKKQRDAVPVRTHQLINATIWFPYAAMNLPFALGCRYIDPDFFGETQEEIDCWAYMNHAASGYYFTPRAAFICMKPTSFHVNDIGRPHNPKGPALTYSDGLRIYSWRGVVISSDLIEKPESITCQRINAEKNAEMRRVLMDIYGESKYLMDSNATKVDESSYGTLFRLPINLDEALVMVRVRNSTPEPDGSYKFYYLRVPPTTTTAKQAVAWTFGLEENQYNPNRES